MGTKTTSSNNGPISSSSVQASTVVSTFNVTEPPASMQMVEKEKGQLDKTQPEQKKSSPSPPKQIIAPVQSNSAIVPPVIVVPVVPQAKKTSIQSSGTPVEPQ